MIAVDTNLFVYEHRRDTDWHDARVWSSARSPRAALDQMAAWTESPSLVLVCEGARYQAHPHEVLTSSRSSGPRVHDARIAALCAYHGIDELWSADRDFSRFPGLRVHNPLLG